MEMKLAGLKLTAVKQPLNVSDEHVRRNKIVKRLVEQRELATAVAAGVAYRPEKMRTVVDKATGERSTVTVNKRVKQWWFATDDSRLALTVRYGSQILELARGKFSIDVLNLDQLVPTIDLVIEAVRAGELDTQIGSAAGVLKRGFKK
jgi:TRAP-type mannitol/chloroaromatic compound transport system substrate-binding protein